VQLKDELALAYAAPRTPVGVTVTHATTERASAPTSSRKSSIRPGELVDRLGEL